ncbi:hypothetical protein LSCM4_07469 [Leishmania orientalis]|uniref:EGF-like domain-containing protein n=1 Tax=Leishmania orientalis TaxID=2249476 RepID=A0A836KUS4_9TRYP|nr:hypothetical protein LSCM4_07469 [Leishmania orientalis]
MVMALVVASMEVAQAADFTTAQCRELSRCDVDGTLVYSFSGVCVCCPEPPAGSILPVQCVPSTPHCPSLPYCTACDAPAGKCDACLSGYVLETTTSTCTQCLASTCDICQRDSEGRRCQLCSEGSYWSTGGQCHSLSESDASGSDMKCRVAFCRTCTSPASGTCSKCDDGYTKDTNGLCVSGCTVPSCDMCYNGDAADCQLCSPGNQWTSKGCSAATTGCRVGHCTTCAAGDNSRCETCESGFTLAAGYCLPPKSCTDANCVSCTGDTSTCTQCKDGYGLVKGTCAECEVEHCDHCDNDVGNCTKCASSYYLTPLFTCSQVPCNIEHCIKCDPKKPSRCQQCAAPYVVDSDANCVSCTGDTSTCTQCKDGYGLVKGTCAECEVEHCDHCDNDVGNCTKCASSYYLTPLFTCSQVPCNIEHCIKCDPKKPSRCQQCAAPYVVDSYDGLCRLSNVCSVPNCKMCRADTSRLCAECDAGYSLSADATSCSDPTTQSCQVEHCNTCVEGDSTRCAYCDTGYYVSNGKCQAVEACYVSKCAQCMLRDSTKCSTCMSGYLLTSSYRCVSQRIVNGVVSPYSLWMTAAVLLASVAASLA